MKTELELNEMILEISNKIRKNCPELLAYLDEMPLTVPYIENPEMVAATLTTYYDSLVDLFEKNNDKNAKNKLDIPFETAAIPEIKTMELDNTYQNLIIEIKLKPVLTIADAADADKALRVIEMSEKNCLISNSITSTVILEPEIVVNAVNEIL